MSNNDEDQIAKKNFLASNHMANERTFLAWVRTSIGIMAFGFVVERFALFIKQIAFLLGQAHSDVLPHASHPLQGYSAIFGVFLVALGVLICLMAFINYKKVAKQIDSDTYQSSTLLNVVLAFSVLLIGIFLMFYLSVSI